jgi:hypothetical protein
MSTLLNAQTISPAGLIVTPDSNGDLKLQSNGTTVVTVTNTYYVGINNASPTTSLSVYGTTYIGGNLQIAPSSLIIDSLNSQGQSGQVLTSNGAGNVYWSSISGALSANVNAQYTWVNTHTFSNTITFTGAVRANTVNAASHTVGTSTIANTTGVYTGIVNAASHTVGTNFVANTTGVYTTGIVNTAAITGLSNTLTLSGNSSTLATLLTNAAETTTVNTTVSALTGTINYYVSTQSVLYFTQSAAANWTPNVAFSSTTSLDTAMNVGQTLSIAFLATQGSTAYYSSTFKIDNVSVTPKWLGGSAPGFGNPSGIDAYFYTIIKTGSATWTVLASSSRYT